MHLRASCDPGGSDALTSRHLPNPLQKGLFFVLRACVYVPCTRFVSGLPARRCASPIHSVVFVFVPLFFLIVFFALFLFLLSRSNFFVDIPLIFSCPADHLLPDWQPFLLLVMMARSVNVKNTHTHSTTSSDSSRSTYYRISHSHLFKETRRPISQIDKLSFLLMYKSCPAR